MSDSSNIEFVAPLKRLKSTSQKIVKISTGPLVDSGEIHPEEDGIFKDVDEETKSATKNLVANVISNGIIGRYVESAIEVALDNGAVEFDMEKRYSYIDSTTASSVDPEDNLSISDGASISSSEMSEDETDLEQELRLEATDYVLDIMTVSVAHFYVKDIIQQVIHDNK